MCFQCRSNFASDTITECQGDTMLPPPTPPFESRVMLNGADQSFHPPRRPVALYPLATQREFWAFVFRFCVIAAAVFLVLYFFVKFTGKADGAVAGPSGSSLSCDFNGDGFVTGEDFDAYVAAFRAGDASSDFNGDGFVTGEDFDAFTLAFGAVDGWTLYPLAEGAVEFRCFNDAQVKDAWTKIDRSRGDRILLAAGQTFSSLGKLPFAGSPDRPMLIGRFGDGPNPVVQCRGTQPGLECSGGGGSPPSFYLQVVGLTFQTDRGDKDAASGIFFGRGGSLSIEGCSVVGFSDNLNVQGPASAPARFRLHRSYIGYAYSRDGSHSQGIYLQDLASAEITENVFDHNGWKDAADRTIFNHNTYLSRGVRRVVLRGNLSVDASATGLASNYESVIDRNLVVNCPVGIFFRPGSSVTDNVIVGSGDIAPDIQRGMGLQLLSVHPDDSGGFDGPIGPARIEGNIVASKGPAVAGREAAIIVNSNSDGLACPVFISNNIVFDWPNWPGILGGVNVDPSVPSKGNADPIAVDGHQFAPNGSPLSSWPAAGRTLDGYAKSIGLKGQAEFLARAAENRIGAWDEKLTGLAARAWIAEGYGR